MVKVTIEGITKEYEAGTSYETIAKEYREKYPYDIALVLVNGKIRELAKVLEKDCTIEFLMTNHTIGHKTYLRTATFLMVKAMSDVIGKGCHCNIKVEFAIGDGYFCRCKGDFPLTEELMDKVNQRMKELIQLKVPILKKAYHLDDAKELFRVQGMKDKEKLFRYRRSSFVNIYSIEDYHDYYYGYMLPSTDYVTFNKVALYEDGFIYQCPNKNNPKETTEVVYRDKLFKTMDQAGEWALKMGIDTVGDLNERICEGKIGDLILVQEAFQESRIGEIAKEIAQRSDVKMIMIAGPSSSGKTTFSHRLSIQLMTYGLKPHPIAVDDYFVNRDKTPLDENGDFNFECLGAIDIEQFNIDMQRLLAGEEVELPTFNFKTGLREYKGNVRKLGEGDILVIEGIHALNDKMSYSLPKDCKYKIYISALTALNIDEHNRIATTDSRLIRRMVRDARTRGALAQRTLQMWTSVRRGEEENIFPYQESADAMFNSASIYELAVLKQFAEPLLFNVKRDEPEYYEAKRLLKFLEYFLGVSSENLPNNSIIREFVGGSCFHV